MVKITEAYRPDFEIPAIKAVAAKHGLSVDLPHIDDALVVSQHNKGTTYVVVGGRRFKPTKFWSEVRREARPLPPRSSG